jgi:D-3-phosphoglycerate dehydrogenase
MRVVAWSPSLDDARAEAAGVDRAASLSELLAIADALSVHVPYRKATHHLIGAAELSQMKHGALLVHTARGGVVDDIALATAVREGRIRAGLDVFEGEPEGGETEFSRELLTQPGLVATPHIGASTDQASEAIGDEVVRIVRDFQSRGVVHNCVNLVRERAGGYVLVVRHVDRVGVLARVLDALREEELSVKEMQNVVFASSPEEEGAASATISIERPPSGELVARLRQDLAILAVDVREMA